MGTDVLVLQVSVGLPASTDVYKCCSQAFSPDHARSPPSRSAPQALLPPAVVLWPTSCSACCSYFYFYSYWYFYSYLYYSYLYSYFCLCAGESATEHAWLKDGCKPARHQWPDYQLPAISHPQDLPGAAARSAVLHESCAGHDQPQPNRLWRHAQVLHLPGRPQVSVYCCFQYNNDAIHSTMKYIVY